MILLADLGNTRLKLATLDAQGGVSPYAALAHAEADFESALADALDGLGAIASIWLASSSALIWRSWKMILRLNFKSPT